MHTQGQSPCVAGAPARPRTASLPGWHYMTAEFEGGVGRAERLQMLAEDFVLCAEHEPGHEWRIPVEMWDS